MAALPAAVYIIENTINNKIYIGQSSQYPKRWTTHKRQLRKGKHDNKSLQEDYDKYGLDVFEFKVVLSFPSNVTEDTLRNRERELIIENIKKDQELYNTIN